MLLKGVFFSTLIVTITTRQVSTEKIDFKKIFHTPKDYDKLEILERSGFEPDDPVGNDRNQPKAFANAQVLLNFDHEETDRKSRDKKPQYFPYPSQYTPCYTTHPFPPYFHPPPCFYPYHPYHGGCFWTPPCFSHPPPQEFSRKFPDYPIDIRGNKPIDESIDKPIDQPIDNPVPPSWSETITIVPDKSDKIPETTERKPNEKKIEDYLNGEFNILVSKEPTYCVGCGPSSPDRKFPADVDLLMTGDVNLSTVNQNPPSEQNPPPCLNCGEGRNGRCCPSCAKYTKELNDAFSP